MGATSSGPENIGAGIPTRVLGSAPSRLTNAQARDLAGWLGWKEVKPPSGISKQTKGSLSSLTARDSTVRTLGLEMTGDHIMVEHGKCLIVVVTE
jgi:hypothetical protein